MPQHPTLITSDHPIPPVERAVLYRLLDLMIPASPDRRMPSAGTLDLYADRGRLSDAAIATLCDGLRELDELARTHQGCGFDALEHGRAMPLVDEYRSQAPAFFAVFVTQSAARYYQSDQVMVALGLEPRPPWPQGHELPDGDWSLLDPVRERGRSVGKLYRE